MRVPCFSILRAHGMGLAVQGLGLKVQGLWYQALSRGTQVPFRRTAVFVGPLLGFFLVQGGCLHASACYGLALKS